MVKSSRDRYQRLDIQNSPAFREQFSSRHRELFYNWTIGGMTYKQLGEIFGIQPHYVSQLLRRMKRAYDEVQEESA